MAEASPQYVLDDPAGVFAVAWSPRGDTLVTGGADGVVRLWSPEGEPLGVFEGHDGPVRKLAWGIGGEIASAGDDGTARIWSPEGEALEVMGHERVLSVAWGPEGQLATSGADATVRIWRPGGEEGPVLQGLKGVVGDIAWGPGGRIAAVDDRGEGCIWTPDEARPDRFAIVSGHEDPALYGIAWGPEGLLIAVGADGAIHIWSSRGMPMRTIQGHPGAVRRVAWGEAGLLATAGADGTARIWTLEGEPVAVFEDHRAPVFDVAWSPDGRLATVGEDGMARIWSPKGDPLHAFAADGGREQGTSPPVGPVPGEPDDVPDGIAPEAVAIPDVPVADPDHDRLDYNHYAIALAAMLENPGTRTPMVSAINAPWGTGKSSIAKMTLRHLESVRDVPDLRRATLWDLLAPRHTVRPRRFHAVEFNAWMHDHEDALTPALVWAVSRGADARRPLLHRMVRPLPRHLWMPGRRWRNAWSLLGPPVLLALVAGAGIYATWQMFGGAAWSQDVAALGATGITGGLAALWRTGFKRLKAYVSDPTAEEKAANIPQVRRDLERLIGRPGDGRPLVVVVDDLERCRPPNAVDVLETVEQLLKGCNVHIILLADLELVAGQVSVKYDSLASSYRQGLLALEDQAAKQLYGHNYVQKIVQIQLDVPRPTQKRLQWLADDHLKDTFGRDAVDRCLTDGAKDAEADVSDASAVAATEEPVGALDKAQITATVKQAVKQGTARILEGLEKMADRDATGVARETLEEAREEAAAEVVADPCFVVHGMEAAKPHLPQTPRGVIRFTNRFRLLLHILTLRGAVGRGNYDLAGHLGRWCIVQERWPSVGRALREFPGWAQDLADMLANHGEAAFNREVVRVAGSQTRNADLQAFFAEHWVQEWATWTPVMASLAARPDASYRRSPP